jgi:hypothetical protein
MVKGLVMNSEELKKMVAFFISKGVSPTVKELCGSNLYSNLYLNYFENKRVS